MTSDTLKPCVVFDVDGTLAHFDADRLGHLVHGEEKNWQEFHEAMATADVIFPVARLFRLLKQAGETMVICSGRPEAWVEYTTTWLQEHNLAFDAIYLRPTGADTASDPDVKRALLAQMKADGFDPWIVVDDRSSVVEAWRNEGLICLQCAPGQF
ncbi:hypothetical protein SAMN04488030_1673 [Aliiroseovarius halocynthiae]|uniref:Polynucleotide kinase n=1 Tax=Aliiroseovarius halocynthiae TaxID=985055 RepID=A0A545SS91_9RHOB|nr:polynucleotide kinase [Aliiroseovarius halocynthiae]TQV67833.1 polynucleotide kinase [Aliiroseovarius halocynthiae]SMR72925.1 hypothetical protein SAMN04488030_1673 [Aliiroseovarius halocynthiae]